MNNDPAYPEVAALKLFYRSQTVQIIRLDHSLIEDTLYCDITLKGIDYPVLIQDEYQDFKCPNTLLHLVLALREWEFLEESADYLVWCREQGYPGNREVLRRYYQDMVKVLPKIATHFKRGKIDSFVTDLDFQLDAGAVHYLRNTTFS